MRNFLTYVRIPRTHVRVTRWWPYRMCVMYYNIIIIIYVCNYPNDSQFYRDGFAYLGDGTSPPSDDGFGIGGTYLLI